MKKIFFALCAAMIFMCSTIGVSFAETTALSPSKPIDGKTAQFIQGHWKVNAFLGFQMITKEDIEYPDGEKILGKEVIIAPNLFSTQDFAPGYEKYATHIWNGHYRVVDELSGEGFYSAYQVSQDVTKIKDSDLVILIQAESDDGSLSGPMLIDVNHARLLLYLNCDYFELQKNTWAENDMDVAIYDTNVHGDGYYHVEYHNNAAELVLEKEQVYLLMVNGGFVPYPDIRVVSGRALAPIESILEPLGGEVEYNVENRTLMVTIGSTRISLNIDDIQADVNGEMKGLDAAPTVINSEVYTPIRFVAETLGANVEYIPSLSNGGSARRGGNRGGNVSVISIELPGQASEAYSPEEGLGKVKEASAAEYQALLDYFALGNRTFDDNFNKDYDSQHIIFTGQAYGRYYVYRLGAFPGYNIFFNKYTGEVFSEKPGLPFLHISKGFINVSWMYQ